MVPQFQDLTEIPGGYIVGIKRLQTEFAFAVAAPGQNFKDLSDYGFKHLADMNNWWPTHAGENRKLEFWWLKQDAANLEKAPMRRGWCYYEHGSSEEAALKRQLASSGCGFKLAQPPISKKEHYRFFTLLRMPIVVSPLRLKLLKEMNYRHIDTGKLASYWLNGWDPKEYSHAMEYKYFGITHAIWSAKGNRWWHYEASQHQK